MAERNVEIKCRVTNASEESLHALCFDLCESHGELLKQRDTFFGPLPDRPGAAGRRLMKLRGDAGRLYYYERPIESGPKLSTYYVSYCSDAASTRELLGRALGHMGDVCKTRRLFHCGRTRVHLDSVEGLGLFIELEVQLTAVEAYDSGEKEAHELMDRLQLDRQNLVAGAYIDLLLAKGAANGAAAATGGQ